MATIDSRAPHPSTPGQGAPQPGSGEPPADGPGSSGRRHRPWRRRILLALGAVVTTAVVVVALLAAFYQPVQFGDSYGGLFPGLPAGTGIRAVNTFGGATGQTYVPPQRGVFTLTESIQNTGPETVTILAVSILSPQEQADDTPSGVAPWPLTPAGTARWMTPEYTGPNSHVPSRTGSFATSVPLAPGEYLSVGIPLRMSGRCYDPTGYTGNDTFYVEERFGIFIHWVAVTVGSPWVMHGPYDPGNRTSGPASQPIERPAKDLVCPAT
jgi:hypothetical protein